jgi:uncharacterized protein YndB with AHSA1/START domain
MPADYTFLDEWDVDAPIDAVFDAIADGARYPEWWPIYEEVVADGPPALGQTARMRFHGRLPYSLTQTATIVRFEPPHALEIDVAGDLTGRGVWTFAQRADGRVHAAFDWRVRADKPLLRVLTPILRPAFRWNHNYAIGQAMAGLEPYLRRRSREAVAAA